MPVRLPNLYYETIIDCQLSYSTLRKIYEESYEELDKIITQDPWLLGIYSDLKASAVDGCRDRVSIALEKFKVCQTSESHGSGA